MYGIWYATVEDVQESLEITNLARSNRLVASKLESSSRSVEGQLHRRFYPERRTFKIDWPNYQYMDAWQLDLGDNELISLESFTSGGVSIPVNDIILRRWDNKEEPPYQYLEINLSSSSAFMGGATYQQSLVLTGLAGWSNTDTSVIHGTLSGGINSSVTSVVLTPVAGQFPVGIGSIILIGTERMILTARSMADTGINTAGSLTDSQNAETLPVADGSVFAVGEGILVNAGRMRIDDIAGNNLIVSRAWDGSALANHLTNQDVFA